MVVEDVQGGLRAKSWFWANSELASCHVILQRIQVQRGEERKKKENTKNEHVALWAAAHPDAQVDQEIGRLPLRDDELPLPHDPALRFAARHALLRGGGAAQRQLKKSKINSNIDSEIESKLEY